MNNPILQSERFERAAHALVSALENFSRGTFEDSVRSFCAAVDRLSRISGMNAENDQRKAIGASMAFTESDFANI